MLNFIIDACNLSIPFYLPMLITPTCHQTWLYSLLVWLFECISNFPMWDLMGTKKDDWSEVVFIEISGNQSISCLKLLLANKLSHNFLDTKHEKLDIIFLLDCLPEVQPYCHLYHQMLSKDRLGTSIKIIEL